MSWVVETGWQLLVGMRWVLWAVIGVAALVAAYKVGRPAVALVGAAWIVAATILPGAYAPVATPTATWRKSEARVVDLHLIDELLDSRHSDGVNLLRPYYVMELGFVPAGVRDTVVAVDAVDSGSVTGLAHGMTVAIRYDPGHPRSAVLAAGRRTYPSGNRPLYWLFAGDPPLSLTILLLLALSRRPTPPTKPRSPNGHQRRAASSARATACRAAARRPVSTGLTRPRAVRSVQVARLRPYRLRAVTRYSRRVVTDVARRAASVSYASPRSDQIAAKKARGNAWVG
ncbi:MAG: DUF3592 domain-containing protein, partial [Gemmatimonadales bacterium]